VNRQKKELVVVEPMPAEAAKQQFIEWRAQHPEIISRLGPEDVIVDVIRATGGRTLHRYKILIDETHVA
jgi:hypothetical protein